MSESILKLKLPNWLLKHVAKSGPIFATREERMDLVVELSRRNILYRSGGPFAAAVFDGNTGALFAAGVNLVVSGKCSAFHAEIVALMAAQKRAGTHDLSSIDATAYELVSSTEPCAMCLGAVQWSGIRRLVCGARGSDAEAAGFDEGEKPRRWMQGLERRGIEVIRDMSREKASRVLQDYRAAGGILYNPRYRSVHPLR
jgi:tRNA(Arg) A34 adenosine deaminase TadA